MIKAFVSANRRLSRWLTPDHQHESNVFYMFAKVAAQIIALPTTRTVLDAGAGASWFFDDHFKRAHKIRLIGVDIDAGEMALNDSLDERHVGSVCDALPVRAGSVDAITAYSGVEHFPDNQAFLRNCFEALRPGGRFIAQFPSRYALFATINRLLPQKLAHAVLFTLRPGTEGHMGFRAHYDRTNYSAFKAMAEAEGFEVEYHLPGYYDAYFNFFTPLFLVWQLVCTALFFVGAKNFATYNLFVLRKPGRSEELYLAPRHVRKAHATPLQAVA